MSLFLCLIQSEPPGIADPSTIAVVLDNGQLQDFVQILDPPTVVSGDRTVINVEYRCTDSRYVGLEVVSDVTNIYINVAIKVFQYTWRCHSNEDFTLTTVRKVRLKLPDELAFNYNGHNTNVSFGSRTRIRAWVLEPDWLEFCLEPKNCYTRSFVKVTYNTVIQTPYLRPYKTGTCRTWGFDMLHIATSYIVPTCPIEEGKFLY